MIITSNKIHTHILNIHTYTHPIHICTYTTTPSPTCLEPPNHQGPRHDYMQLFGMISTPRIGAKNTLFLRVRGIPSATDGIATVPVGVSEEGEGGRGC